MAIEIREAGAGDGALLQQLTLRSLVDAPYAFGGAESFAEESSRPEEEWRGLAAECAGEVPEWRERCVGYLVFDGAEACGKALCYLSPRNEKLALFSAMWIDPRIRRRGVGRQVVERAIAWATGRGAERLKLWVDDTNPGGVAFYGVMGFVPTGESRAVVAGSGNLERAFVRGLVAG